MELCVIEGDGVGREVVPAAVRVLLAVLPDIIIHEAEAGFDCFQAHGTSLPQETIDLAVQCRSVLFGAADSPSYPVGGYFDPIVELRQILNAYANIRPTIHLPVATARDGVDIVLIHKNAEGLYNPDCQDENSDSTGTAQQVITRSTVEQVTHQAIQT